MRISIVTLTALVSIAYADDGKVKGNGADDSGGGSLTKKYGSPSSIKSKEQPPSRDRSKYIEMRSYLRKKLSRSRKHSRSKELRNSIADELELDLPEPFELCGKSLGILHGAHGACSSEEDVCVHVKEQGTGSSWTNPYDENSESYGICLPRSLAETHKFQPVYYGDAAVYMGEDHRLLGPEDAATVYDCGNVCSEPRFEVEGNADLTYRIRSCYPDRNSSCPTTAINCWDTSSVDSMEGAFYDLIGFNECIQGWDTSGVTSMSRMFGAESGYFGMAFNKPLSSWNVSQVQTMSKMFYHAPSFSQYIGKWDVSSVTDMSNMFGAKDANNGTTFNESIGSWDVGQVRTMSKMFYHCDFDLPIGNWDVSSVTDMSYMFGKQQHR